MPSGDSTPRSWTRRPWRCCFPARSPGSTALVQPLRSADSLIGAVLVVGDRRQLTLMQDAIQAIGFKVALALQRIALARELHQRASEAHFRALIQNASDVILVVGTDNQITYQTPSAARVLGYHPSDLAGRRLEQLLPPGGPRAIPVEARADASVWRRPRRQGRLAAAVRGRQVDRRRGRVQQPAGRPGRARPGAHDQGRHRSPKAGAGARAPRLSRQPHVAGEPWPVLRSPSGRAASRGPHERAGRRALHRRRRLQGHQRHPGARRRGQGAPTTLKDPRDVDPGRGQRSEARRRRVRPPGGGCRLPGRGGGGGTARPQGAAGTDGDGRGEPLGTDQHRHRHQRAHHRRR